MASTPRSREVAEPGAHAGEVADAVAVAVGEAAQVDLVDDGVAPPLALVAASLRAITCRPPRSRFVARGDGVSPATASEADRTRCCKKSRNLRIIATDCSRAASDVGRSAVRRARSSRGRRARGRRAARIGPSRSPSSWLIRRSTAARPIASIGWRTVVSGGSVKRINAESSNPTTDTSPGTCSPRRRTARIAPRASGSLAQTTAVTPVASKPSPAA